MAAHVAAIVAAVNSTSAEVSRLEGELVVANEAVESGAASAEGRGQRRRVPSAAQRRREAGDQNRLPEAARARRVASAALARVKKALLEARKAEAAAAKAAEGVLVTPGDWVQLTATRLMSACASNIYLLRT